MQRLKADLYGIIERIFDMYEKKKMTITEIETQLKSEGYDISRSSVHRSLKSYKQVAKQQEKYQEEAKVLIDTVRNTTNTDLVETINILFASKLFDYVKDLDSIELENAPTEISQILYRLSRAQVDISRLRLQFEKGFKLAKQKVSQAIAKELQNEPELLSKLIEIVKNLDHDED